MQMKNETQSGLAAEIKIVPPWAWALAGFGFIAAQIFFNVMVARQSHPPSAAARAALGILLGVVLGCYLLFLGYVSRDARRRGMNPILWTLVALLIPNGLGIILYFILRQPLSSAFLQGGSASLAGFGSCPRCGYKLSANCPHCQRVVGVDDNYCRYCGTALHNQAVPAV
jgi:hypothetical protein